MLVVIFGNISMERRLKMEIKEKLTKVNYKESNNRKISYIVIHYVRSM